MPRNLRFLIKYLWTYPTRFILISMTIPFRTLLTDQSAYLPAFYINPVQVGILPQQTTSNCDASKLKKPPLPISLKDLLHSSWELLFIIWTHKIHSPVFYTQDPAPVSISIYYSFCWIMIYLKSIFKLSIILNDLCQVESKAIIVFCSHISAIFKSEFTHISAYSKQLATI